MNNNNTSYNVNNMMTQPNNTTYGMYNSSTMGGHGMQMQPNYQSQANNYNINNTQTNADQDANRTTTQTQNTQKPNRNTSNEMWAVLLKNFRMKFDPDKGSLIGFLDGFEGWTKRMEMSGGEITDEEKGTMLMMCLTDTPRGACQRLTGYKAIVQQLKDCYLRDKISLKAEVKKMRQSEGESIARWIARLHTAATELRELDANFTEENERDIFFTGLNAIMQLKVHIHGLKTYKELKEHALGIEAMESMMTAPVVGDTSGALAITNKMFAGRIDNNNTNNNRNNNYNNNTRRDTRGTSPTCYHCGENGHTIRECRI